jgi:putative endonuclease
MRGATRSAWRTWTKDIVVPAQAGKGCADGFTKKYGLTQLVWYEVHGDVREAITREKRIKRWNRDWKVNLIQRMNPTWRDLYLDLTA